MGYEKITLHRPMAFRPCPLKHVIGLCLCFRHCIHVYHWTIRRTKALSNTTS